MRLLIFRAVFNGYNGVFDEVSLNQLLNDPSVAFIEPDYVANISYTVSPFRTSTHLARHRPRRLGTCAPKSGTPGTPGKDNGTGVDIYGLGERSCF